nr:oxygen-evolving enhancer protein 3-2 [Hymenophyllum caudiculatum]
MATSSATVAMAGIVSSTTPSLNTSSSPSSSKFLSLKPAFLPVRASIQPQSEDASSTRRSLLGLLVAAPSVLLAAEAFAAAPVKVEPAPPPFGGLPGTQNADEARDTDLPLKQRFFIQALAPTAAVVRAKDSAKDIVGVKALIDKKAWPYVQNDLRLKASCLRFDLNTIIAAKPTGEKKALKSLVTKLFATIDNLDYAARSKSVPKAEKYYAETVSALNDLLSKIA